MNGSAQLSLDVYADVCARLRELRPRLTFTLEFPGFIAVGVNKAGEARAVGAEPTAYTLQFGCSDNQHWDFDISNPEAETVQRSDKIPALPLCATANQAVLVEVLAQYTVICIELWTRGTR